ncbi:MAG: arginine deiminase family protein [Pseudomonadota bacterium]|nr:arginine deiminase family protein [Pseudomonadota bacterium]
MSEFVLKHRVEGGGTRELSDWGMNSEYGVLREVLLGPIENYRWLETSSVSRRTIRLGYKFDLDVAKHQHAEMEACYRDAGVTVRKLKADPALPYQVFARDSSVMTPWGPVISQMGHWWRRGEYGPVISFYHDNDIPIYDVITAGAFEGGDFQVIKPGSILCGFSDTDRTQRVAVDQLKSWIEAEGWELKTYQFDPFFVHLDVFFAMLTEGLAAMCTEIVEPDLVEWVKSRGIEILEVTYEDAMTLGCNVVSLGNDRVMIPSEAKNLQELCQAKGLKVYAPDISMISKGGGSLHCLCQPLRRDPV